MTLRDDVLPIISDGWDLVEELGVTQYTATIRTRTWSGGKVQLGTATVSDTQLTPNPWVEERANGAELVLSGITPAFSGGGYSPSQLNPSVGAAVESYWVMAGPNGSHNYEIVDINTGDAFEYIVTLRALTRAAPF